MADEQIIWLTADIVPVLDADGVEFTLSSRACCKTFRTSRARLRRFVDVASIVLDEDARKPSNVRRLRKQRAH